jgi:hypothetical protein
VELLVDDVFTEEEVTEDEFKLELDETVELELDEEELELDVVGGGVVVLDDVVGGVVVEVLIDSAA